MYIYIFKNLWKNHLFYKIILEIKDLALQTECGLEQTNQMQSICCCYHKTCTCDSIFRNAIPPIWRKETKKVILIFISSIIKGILDNEI